MPADDARASSARAWIAPAAIAAGTFVLCYGLAQALSRAGVFAYLDVLFDTDAAWYLQGLSEGRGTGTGWGARSVVHPNVANLINPPLRLIAEICASVGACADPAVVRPKLALIVSPAAAAIEAVFVFLTIRTLYRSDVRATLAALLGVALLPTLLFGSVPESFALTGCAFAALFYAVSRHAVGRPVGAMWWAVIGIALSSITVTNIWLFAVGYTVAHAGDRWVTPAAGVAAVRASVIALLSTAGLALAIGSAYGALSDYRTALQQLTEVRAPRQDLAERRWTDAARDGLALAATGAFLTFPRALGDTVLPPRPSIHGTALGLDTAGGTLGVRPEPSLHANFRNTSADWGTFVALAALAGALIAAVTSRGPQRLVFRVAIALVAANWVFHSVFGFELFLYAKHWSVAVTILLAAWFELKRPVAYAGMAVVVVLLLLAVLRDVRVFTHLFGAFAGS